MPNAPAAAVWRDSPPVFNNTLTNKDEEVCPTSGNCPMPAAATAAR